MENQDSSATATILVISDLHLGGDPRFAICSAEGRRLLLEFLIWVVVEHKRCGDVHLVVNGDSVDFLAETEFQAFTADDAGARQKLKNILDYSAPIWSALREVMAAGVQVTFTLGNHDLELSLPGPRALLAETIGPGRFDFLYDNQALRIGDVLIEHGNRYDRWNSVDHEALRHLRVQVSRGLEAPEFTAPAGSHMVVEVINLFKPEYSFINLLKPENEAAIPLLAVLDPWALEKMPQIAFIAAHATESQRDHDEIAANIAGEESGYHPDDRAAIEFARSLVPEGDANEIRFEAVKDFLEKFKANAGAFYRNQQLATLYKAFRYWLAPQLTAFDTALEAPAYRNAAIDSARAGFNVIVYGHTHLAKKVALPNGATYLNTGTWADLISIPDSIILSSSFEEAKQDLEQFVNLLQDNPDQLWRRPLPTFARIEMKDGKALSSSVFLFEGSATITEIPAGRLSRLLGLEGA